MLAPAKELKGLGLALAGMDVTFPLCWRAITGVTPLVGVGWGVEAAEFALPTEMGAGVFLALTLATVGWCTIPSSPGANVRAEQ